MLTGGQGRPQNQINRKQRSHSPQFNKEKSASKKLSINCEKKYLKINSTKIGIQVCAVRHCECLNPLNNPPPSPISDLSVSLLRQYTMMADSFWCLPKFLALWIILVCGTAGKMEQLLIIDIFYLFKRFTFKIV